MARHIPNLLTLMNLLAGAVTIVLIVNGDYLLALIPAAASQLFDFLDGLAARLLKAYSSIGRQLDSLADLVSFGVAPSFLLFGLLRTVSEPAGQWWLPYISFLYLLAAAWRLAAFNIDTGQSRSFRGLPTPAAAIMVLTIPLLYRTGLFDGYAFVMNRPFLLLMVLLPSALMLSKLRLFSLKVTSLGLGENLHRYLLLLGIVLVLVLDWTVAGVAVVPIYLLLSLSFRAKVMAEEAVSKSDTD